MKVVLFNNKIQIHTTNTSDFSILKSKYTANIPKTYRVGKDLVKSYISKYLFSRSVSTPVTSYIELPYGEVSLLNDLQIPVTEYEDNRSFKLRYLSRLEVDTEFTPDILEGITLRDYQVIGCKLALYSRLGIVESGTGSGKTEMLIALIKFLQHKYKSKLTICIVGPTIVVLDTIIDRLHKYGYNHDDIIKNDHKTRKMNDNIDFDGKIIVTHAKSFDKIPDPDIIDVMIYDECHHIKSDTWSSIISKVSNVQMSIGFSATIDKSVTDYDYRKIVGSVGKVIYSVPSHYLRSNELLAELSYIQYNLSYDVDCEIPESNDWAKIRSYITSEPRAIEISKVIDSIVMRYPDTKILVLSDTIKLSSKLLELSSNKDKSYCYFGGDTLKYYSDDNNLITTSFSSSSNDVDTRTVVYATTHMDEGVDIDKLDILILTSGGSKKRRVVQRVGRVSRLSKTLKKGIVIDFTDSEQAVLRSQSVKRKSYTKSLGVIIEDDVSTLTSLHNSLDIIEKE